MRGSVKILAIGNSFSVDAMEYLWQVLCAGGVERVTLGNLYIPGCPLELHVRNAREDAPAYVYYKSTDGHWRSTPDISLSQGLLDEEWDIITLQQASHDSGLSETYAPQRELLDYALAHRRSPEALLYWHMTWAYQATSDHWAFPRYGRDQRAMYQSILGAVRDCVLPESAYAGVIPTGVAIQRLRQTPVGDTLTRDGFHLSLSHGRYTAALTWAQTLCGVDPDAVDWMPPAYGEVLERDLAYIRSSVKEAAIFF